MNTERKTITISRQLKVNNKLKNYLEDNMWYRRKIYNKFVEWYKEWDETREDGMRYDFNKASGDMYQYELSEFDYNYYCTGIREKCAKDMFDTVKRVIKERKEGHRSQPNFTRYDKYTGSFKVATKPPMAVQNGNPTSSKCMILDDTHVQFTFNRRNKQILELKEPLKYNIDDIEPRIMFKSFTSQRYRFRNVDIKEVAFVKKLNKYYINFIVEVEILDYDKYDRNFLAGIDLGIRNPVTLCYLNEEDKEVIEKFNMSEKEYRHMKYLEDRISRLQKIMSRKMLINKERVNEGELNTVYTRNYEKVRNKFRISHRKLFNVKRNWRLKLAHYIVNHYDNIVVDEFTNPITTKQTKGIKIFNKAVRELGLSFLMLDLYWLADKYHCNFIKSPSDTTRTCCVCGFVNEHLKLGKNYLKCVKCGTRIDRDVNAAFNCFKFGRKEVVRNKELVKKLKSDLINA